MAPEEQTRSPHWKQGAFLGVLVLVVLTAISLKVAFPYRVGPKQPIPFSHRVHAADKQISCFFCHPFADQGPNPGLPEVSTCLLCHNKIVPDFPPVKKEHDYFNAKVPVPWVRVGTLPDYVYFNHAVHLAKAVDCGRCHGDVKAMDRVALPERHSMGFCVDCHREEEASVDCFVCHR